MKLVNVLSKREEEMGVPKTMVDAVGPDGKWLYRVGGLSALVLGIAYIVIIALYIPIGAPPSGAEAWLTYLAGHTTAWWAILGLSVLTDFLFVPVALSLYLTLKGINRNAMLLATACVGLFVVLDLAITWTNYAALITLSGHYAAATNDTQRAVFVAAAIYPSAVLESGLLFVYNTLTLSVGILVTGFVMLIRNLQQEYGLFGSGHGHSWNCFSSWLLFCKFFECNHNHRFRAHYSLGLVCRLQTLQARSAVIPTAGRQRFPLYIPAQPVFDR
ncbi:MAG: hypothetical protein EHM40_08660 [Chloroflexi bacterium]|nr:MAG: hypothetical protein EHM40_08660 [Chloroflexota bacterium]